MRLKHFYLGLNKVAKTINLTLYTGFLMLLFNQCAMDSMEELIEEYELSDSLQFSIPTISVSSPQTKDSVSRPIIIRYEVTNWPMNNGGHHLQFFINEENKGISYNSSELFIDQIDTGFNTITLRLAKPNFETIDVSATLEIYVKPEEENLFQLFVNNGIGSGAYPANAVISIEADQALDGHEFSHWIGDTIHLSENAEKTEVTMPNQNIEITATYTESKIDYLESIEPIIIANCSNCHDFIFEPILLSCENLKTHAEKVALRIQDETNPMPPTGLMSQAEIDLILKWIEQGSNCN